MTLSRRVFLRRAAPIGLLPLLPACEGAESPAAESGRGLQPPVGVFAHGVASGDPRSDAVILWTRVTPPEPSEGDLEVRWRLARDAGLTDVVLEGVAVTHRDLDYTVKLDATGLSEATTYYYEFEFAGQRSPVGRTRTLPASNVARARVALASCANYPAGYFHVYRQLALRGDIDFVVHLGDYLYEFGNATLGDGSPLGRVPEPDKVIATLDEYRARHAQYKSDPDLREIHRQHPVLAVWDDHEFADDAFATGAPGHVPAVHGDWQERKANAIRAYFEWMPIRPAPDGSAQIQRAFAFGDLFDLILLDARLWARAARWAGNCAAENAADPNRGLLGADQEEWLFEALQSSRQRGAKWRLVAQQVMFSPRTGVGAGCVHDPDTWDGFAENRARVLETIRSEAIDNVVILAGDAHSSWAFDVASDPFDAEAYDPVTGRGSVAVEVVVPAVSSPAVGGAPETWLETHPHLKFVDLLHQGYVLVDLTPERMQAEWYFVPSVRQTEAGERFGAAVQCATGQSHLTRVDEPTPAPEPWAAPAP